MRGRVRRVRAPPANQAPFSTSLNVGIKTQFPAQSGTVYAGPFFLSRPSFLSVLLILRSFHFTTAVSPERCLLNEAFPRGLSFFLLGRNALHAACKQRVVPSRALRCSPFRSCFYLLALSFPRQSWPTSPTLFVGEPTLLIALPFPQSFTWKSPGSASTG